MHLFVIYRILNNTIFIYTVFQGDLFASARFFSDDVAGGTSPATMFILTFYYIVVTGNYKRKAARIISDTAYKK